MESDATLVTSVLGGERARFADLVARHERSVRAAAFAVLGDHHAALDVAQDAFLQAFRNLATLRDGAAFGGWIQTIARNRALSDARRRAPMPALDCVAEPAYEPSDPADADLARRLVEFVAQLPEHEQSVVTLYYFDGHDVRTISEIIGRPIGTVTMRLSRARERLRGWLKE